MKIVDLFTADSQEYPDAAYNRKTGEYLVIWVESRGRGISRKTFLKAWRLSKEGEKIGDPFELYKIDNAVNRIIYNPKVAYNWLDDEFMVSWQVTEQIIGGKRQNLLVQRLDRGGAPVGQVIEIDAFGSDRQNGEMSMGGIVFNEYRASKEYFLTWAKKQHNQMWEVAAQRITAGGALEGPRFSIFTSKDNMLQYPTVAYNSKDNEYLVAWHYLYSENNWDWDIHAQRISLTGELLGHRFVITNTGRDERSARVAYNLIDNEFLAVWMKKEQDGDLNIYAQRVNNQGGRIGPKVTVVNTNHAEARPVVAFNPFKKQYLVVWGYLYADRTPPTPDDWDIHAQLLDNNGKKIGGMIKIARKGGEENDPVISFDSLTGKYFLLWEYVHRVNGTVSGDIQGCLIHYSDDVLPQS